MVWVITEPVIQLLSAQSAEKRFKNFQATVCEIFLFKVYKVGMTQLCHIRDHAYLRFMFLSQEEIWFLFYIMSLSLPAVIPLSLKQILAINTGTMV